jgi:hypothetical protein
VVGSFKSGRGLSGTNIGALTNIAFTGCKVEGVAVTVTVHTSRTNPAPINLVRDSIPDLALLCGAVGGNRTGR